MRMALFDREFVMNLGNVVDYARSPQQIVELACHHADRVYEFMT